jgi:hypothetical protein
MLAAFDPRILKNFEDELHAAFHQLALRGWTISMVMTEADVIELACMSPAETETAFVDHYTADEFTALRAIRKEFETRSELVPWRELFGQCLDAFERRHHLIAIPSLLSIIDGVVSSAGKALTKREPRPAQICASKSVGDPNSMSIAMWKSIAVFVEKLFRYAPFDQDRPGLINRHWSLHGRDSATWTAADALRLFNALQTIDSLLA